MKAKMILCSVAAIAAMASQAAVTGPGIVNCGHNFADAVENPWNTTGEICLPCHAPHGNINKTIGFQTVLWNHSVPTNTYQVYSNPDSMDAVVGQPSGATKLCLSCHDGTVALDNFSRKTNGTWFMKTGTAPPGLNYINHFNFGTDLRATHPLSFTYDTALATADGELFDPAAQITALGGTIAEDLLIGGKFECASCHDVHNKAGNDALLYIENDESALCLTCHNK